MLMGLISRIVDVDGVDVWDVNIDGTFSQYYRRCIYIWDDISAYRALIIIFSECFDN
jgi:hypothetical protein